MAQTEWLVEIRTKSWIAGEQHLGYVEVLAADEISARMLGYCQFTANAKYMPVTRRRMEARGLEPCDWCAPAAIEI